MFNPRCPFHTFFAGALIVGISTALTSYLIESNKKRNKKDEPFNRFEVSKRFTECIKTDQFVFMSGQLGEGETIEEQTKSVFGIIDGILAKCGTDKSKIVEMTIWLSNLSRDYDAMNKVYDEWIVPGKPPCRATVQAQLYSPKYLIEVRVIAAV